MLPKAHRLTRGQDFARVRRHGRSAGSSLMALYVLPNRSSDLRVGFSVSKKVGKATVRNRVKRRLREAIRQQLPELRPGLDLVFIARPPAAQAAYAQIVEASTVVLRKSGAMRQPAESKNHA